MHFIRKLPTKDPTSEVLEAKSNTLKLFFYKSYLILFSHF